MAGSAETTTQQRSHGGGSEQHTPQLIHHPQLHPSQQFQQQHHQLHRQPQPQPQHSLRDINLYQRLPENGLPLIAPAVSISPQASAVSPTGGYVWATDSTINSQTPQPQNLAMDLPKIKRNCVSNACVHCRKKRSKVCKTLSLFCGFVFLSSIQSFVAAPGPEVPFLPFFISFLGCFFFFGFPTFSSQLLQQICHVVCFSTRLVMVSEDFESNPIREFWVRTFKIPLARMESYDQWSQDFNRPVCLV